jgi:hypothetical protein
VRLSKLGLLALTGLAATVGCTENTPRDTELNWRGSFDTLESGAVLVRNPATPLWDSATAWTLEEDLRIGGAEGTEPEAFDSIGAVATDARGNIYVLDGQAQEIRVFAPDGTYRSTIGSPGWEPGELIGALGLACDGRGRLWVPDAGKNQYVVFDSHGDFQSEYRRPLSPAYPYPGIFDTSGRLLDLTATPARQGLNVTPVSFSLDPPRLEDWPPVSYRTYLGPLPRSIGSLRPRLMVSLDRRGFVWFGTTDEYRIYQRTLQGDTVRIVERPSAAVALSDSLREALTAELAEFSARLDPSLIPNHMPVFNRFVLDNAGYLFVGVPGTEEQTGRLIDVFDPEGRYLGRMTSPVHLDWMVPPTLTEDHLLGMARDERNVGYVVRLHLMRRDQS